MRHCKSDWTIGLGDHARSLNDRGHRSAKALGDWLRDHDHLPDQALVSDAQRTQDTWNGLTLDCPVQLLSGLYLAEPDEIWKILQAHGKAETILIIAHNPGIAEFADALMDDTPYHEQFWTYPSGATLVAYCDGDQARPRAMKAVDFVIPRELI